MDGDTYDEIRQLAVNMQVLVKKAHDESVSEGDRFRYAVDAREVQARIVRLAIEGVEGLPRYSGDDTRDTPMVEEKKFARISALGCAINIRSDACSLAEHVDCWLDPADVGERAYARTWMGRYASKIHQNLDRVLALCPADSIFGLAEPDKE